MGKHSPGPWTVEQGSFNHDEVPGSIGSIQNPDWFIATMEDAPEQSANARLIAAAPDLLAIAEEVARDYEDAADWKDARGRLFDMAQAAIAKARGENG